ncbi:helix-turn-helix domain-containing protein [Vibrio sp. TMPB1044]|uniref:GlxA family transcriptional regulator n=1 Tax=Vibrio sp. TMPB1044 TaxID=3051822 RepID=UPI00255B8ED7|nr:helix-turn-helix domain-containing protein [Vibrio sp. TMPB1044]MDL5027191.1 helix-turn-helix domain-containing protein [Vibrio sp. TMPB1044]MDN5207319.1 helix-turn-helix domain-containing protein [Vibrio sp. TMPB1044]
MAIVTKSVKVEIIDYPGSLQSAVFGVKEFLQMANSLDSGNKAVQFQVEIKPYGDLSVSSANSGEESKADIILLPPNLDGSYYLDRDERLTDYLIDSHQKGSILCSACAGVFILAQTGLLEGRTVTTHWQAQQLFSELHTGIEVDIDKILIDDDDIITAGGLMSWMDLALFILTKYTTPTNTRNLGKYLVLDTGLREQRYYQSFVPNYAHGNDKIVSVQRFIQKNHHLPLTLDQLAEEAFMTRRTFIRQFTKATTLTPINYIQHVRVQSACELLESSHKPVEQISYLVGYEDVNSFRKVFMKIIGLTPSRFRARFLSEE